MGIFGKKRLGMGCMRLPVLNEDDDSSFDVPQINRMTDIFLDRGFTYFDNAYMYHDYKSEEMIRDALVKRHSRDKFNIATKLPVHSVKSKADNEKFFNEQLKKLGVDYFDFYLLHNLSFEKMDTVEKFKCFEFIDRKRQEGYIRHIGFSFHDKPELLKRLLSEHPEAEFVQLQLNYLDWENPAISSRRCYETAKEFGKPIIAMEPVKGGTLATVPKSCEDLLIENRKNASIASWAMNYLLGYPEIEMILSGMSNIEQLEDNMETFEKCHLLNAREKELIERVKEEILNEGTVPCTSCRYCTDGCPKKIDIPRCLALYNAELKALNRGFSTQKMYYESLCDDTGSKASDCISCGQCESICPQHIRIISELKNVAKAFEN